MGLSLHTLLYDERKRRHSIHRTPSGGTILHPHLRYKHVPSAPPLPRVAAVAAVDGRGGGPDGRISRQPRSTRVKHLKASPRPPAGHPQAWVHLGPPTTLGSSLVPRQLLTAMSLSPPPPYPPPLPQKKSESTAAVHATGEAAWSTSMLRTESERSLCWGPRFEGRGSPTATRNCMSFVKYKRLHTNTPGLVEPRPPGRVLAPQGCSLCAYIPRHPVLRTRPLSLRASKKELGNRGHYSFTSLPALNGAEARPRRATGLLAISVKSQQLP